MLTTIVCICSQDAGRCLLGIDGIYSSQKKSLHNIFMNREALDLKKTFLRLDIKLSDI